MNLGRLCTFGGFTASFITVALTAPAMAQDSAPATEGRTGSFQNDTAQRPNESTLRPQGQGFGRGFGGGRFGMRALFTPLNALDPFLGVLGEVNLLPTFNLTQEQKQKIADIRASFGRSMEAWRRVSGADLADMQAELRDLSGFGPFGGPATGEDRDPDGSKRNQLVDSIRQVMATAPDGEAEIQSIRALLTPAQIEQLDSRVLQSQIDAERRRSEWFDNSGGAGGAEGSRTDESSRARGE